MSASREVDDGVAIIVKMNMASFPPSSRNCRKEMVDNSGDLLSHVGERDAGSVLFVRSPQLFFSSNQSSGYGVQTKGDLELLGVLDYE